MVPFGRVFFTSHQDKKLDAQFSASISLRLASHGHPNWARGRVLRNDDDDDSNEEVAGTKTGAPA